MKKKHLLLILLMTLLAPWAAAQQSLPYSYGFEDNDLSVDGWSKTGGSSGISTDAAKTGTYGFLFEYASSDAYLMSPVLTGGTYGVSVSLYAKAYSASYLDHFQIGYTTDATATDPSTFTYGSLITSTTSWTEYTAECPAGTARVAIKYDSDNYNDGWYLYLDDFSFTAASSCIAPTNAVATYTSGTTATVTWEGDAKAYNIDVNGTITNDVTSPYVLNVTPATTYTIKVQANCGGEQSGWVNAGTFTTDCPTSYSIPYIYDFENEGGINCWTLDGNVGLDNADPEFAHTGNNFVIFSYTTTPPQYLISPELSGIVKGLHVEFYYRQYTNGVETFHVGYSTTDDDPNSFIWGNEITASTTYQRFSANYPAETKYVAIKHTSDDQYYLFVDDFVFEEISSCLEPSNVVASNETTTGATLGWTAGGEETSWDIYVTSNETDVPNDGTTPTVSNTSTNPYPLTGLTAATTYYAYVRAKCSSTDFSAWSSPAIFNTDCIDKDLPYSYGFEDNEFDICWSTINTNTSYCGVNVMDPSGSSGNHVLAFYRGSSTGTLVAISPEINSSYPLNGYQITFDACYANSSGGTMTAGKLGIGIITDPTDFSTFELIEEIDITDGYSTYGTHTVMFNSYTGSGQYFAIQDIHTQNGYVLVDNIEVTELPACLPPTDVTLDGGLNAVVSWTGTADSFDIAFSDDPTANPEDVIVGTTDQNSFELYKVVSLTEGDYTIWVRANCGGSYSTWVSTTLSLSYCTPNPTSHDGSGITGVSFGTGSYVVTNGDGSASLPASSPFYGDYTSMIGGVNAGLAATIAITTGTGSYPYTFVIWVDLDKDFTFEDDEVLYVGKASAGNGTLNATITIPATQELGDYRMRIYGADSYFTSFYNNGTTDWSAAHDPCNSGTYRHAHDYTVRVLEAPSCLAPSGLDATNITTQSADLSWTANSGETSWNVYYKKTSETDYSKAMDVTDNPYNLTGLDAATNYVYYVTANCSGSETSDPSAEYTFATLCDVMTISPSNYIEEGFEDYTGTTYNTDGIVPNCWDHYSTSFTYPYPHIVDRAVNTSYAYVHDGTKSLSFVADQNKSAYAALPEFTNDWSSLQVSFWMQTESSSSNYKLSLGYITAEDNNYNTYQVVEEFEPSYGSMTEHTVYLKIKNVPAEATRLVFRWDNPYSSYYSCCIDDVLVGLAPAVLPVGTLTYNSVQATSVKLSWELLDVTQDLWQVQYATDENFTENVGTADADTNENFILEGLTAETHYYVRVRSQKEYLGYGDWSNAVDFETMPACSAANVTFENITHHNATVSWYGESSDGFTVYYGQAPDFDPDHTAINEGFESGVMPTGWTIEGDNQTEGKTWKVGVGDYSTSTGTHSGNYNALINHNNANDVTYLVTPSMDLSSMTDVKINLWYINRAWGSDVDYFGVYYRVDGGVWNDLFNTTTAHGSWTELTETLPAEALASNCQIGFRMVDKWGYGVGIDDIKVGQMLEATWQTKTTSSTTTDLTGLEAGTKYEVYVVPQCNPASHSATESFTTIASDQKYFLTAGDWATTTNWMDGEIPAITDNAIINANVNVTGTAVVKGINLNYNVLTVASGASLTIDGAVTGTSGNDKIIVEDGGQLFHENSLYATANKVITAASSWGKDDVDGWYLVATPASNSTITGTSYGVFTGAIDLFKYDEATAYWWAYTGGGHNFSSMYRLTGYLHASQTTQTVGYNGQMVGTSDNLTKDLDYTSSQTADVRGYNLVGNPFTCNLVAGDVKLGDETNIAYLAMNDTRTGFTTYNISERPILVGEAFFVQATAEGQTLVFNPSTAKSSNNGYIRIVAGNENGSDNAYINLANGNTLRKFNIANGTKVYVMNGGEDYAAARVEELAGAIPVNFKAAEEGEYTITINAKNIDANTMILVDDMTGEEIDLLVTPSYTFKATTNDAENRFKLIFDCNNYTGIDENFTGDIFAYQHGNEIIVNGEGTLEVFDVMGRMVLNTKINGVQKVNVPANAVYIFKLMGETVKTQKIVVR